MLLKIRTKLPFIDIPSRFNTPCYMKKYILKKVKIAWHGPLATEPLTMDT